MHFIKEKHLQLTGPLPARIIVTKMIENFLVEETPSLTFQHTDKTNSTNNTSPHPTQLLEKITALTEEVQGIPHSRLNHYISNAQLNAKSKETSESLKNTIIPNPSRYSISNLHHPPTKTTQ
jgi:hypothetical protein